MKPATHLSVSIDDQVMGLYREGACIREFVISTALKGMGSANGSYRTPIGNFRICEKIGGGMPVGTIFKARQPNGVWDPSRGTEGDLILTRILRLDGLEESNANTLERCIYVHGTNREDLLGIPASHGCIRMRNDEIVELFDLVDVGDGLLVHPATRRRGRLLLLDCGALLSEASHLVPQLAGWISLAKEAGWLPVLLAEVPDEGVRSLASAAGIDHVEGLDGLGLAGVARDWNRAMLPVVTVLIGSKHADSATMAEVDRVFAWGDEGVMRHVLVLGTP